jgi:hypothetical protein
LAPGQPAFYGRPAGWPTHFLWHAATRSSQLSPRARMTSAPLLTLHLAGPASRDSLARREHLAPAGVRQVQALRVPCAAKLMMSASLKLSFRCDRVSVLGHGAGRQSSTQWQPQPTRADFPGRAAGRPGVLTARALPVCAEIAGPAPQELVVAADAAPICMVMMSRTQLL